jgi:hypothetical protein
LHVDGLILIAERAFCQVYASSHGHELLKATAGNHSPYWSFATAVVSACTPTAAVKASPSNKCTCTSPPIAIPADDASQTKTTTSSSSQVSAQHQNQHDLMHHMSRYNSIHDVVKEWPSYLSPSSRIVFTLIATRTACDGVWEYNPPSQLSTSPLIVANSPLLQRKQRALASTTTGTATAPTPSTSSAPTPSTSLPPTLDRYSYRLSGWINSWQQPLKTDPLFSPIVMIGAPIMVGTLWISLMRQYPRFRILSKPNALRSQCHPPVV